MNCREMQTFTSTQVSEGHPRYTTSLWNTSSLIASNFPQNISLFSGIPITVGYLVGDQVLDITKLKVSHEVFHSFVFAGSPIYLMLNSQYYHTACSQSVPFQALIEHYWLLKLIRAFWKWRNFLNLPVFKVGYKNPRCEQIHVGNPGYRWVKGIYYIANTCSQWQWFHLCVPWATGTTTYSPRRRQRCSNHWRHPNKKLPQDCFMIV